ncbi:MAG: hypothetical protein ACI4F7_08305 [Acutalibacteraceae bacterium]
MKSPRKIKLPLRAYLLYIIVAALLTTAVSLSKYTTATYGGDSARTVKFGDVYLTETGDFYDSENRLMLAEPGVDIKKAAVVNFNGSETACYIFIAVKADGFTKNGDRNYISSAAEIGDKISWSVSTKWTYLTLKNSEYVYYKTLAPNEVITDTEIIEGSKITVSGELKNSELEKLGNPKISFRAAAVQAGGFENAAKAWDSVA